MEDDYNPLDQELQRLLSEGNYKKILKILEKLMKQEDESKQYDVETRK